MEDRYFAIDTIFVKLDESPTWTLEIKADEDGEFRRIAKWIGEGLLTQDILENITLLWQTLLCAQLNVQLGLELGLIS